MGSSDISTICHNGSKMGDDLTESLIKCVGSSKDLCKDHRILPIYVEPISFQWPPLLVPSVRKNFARDEEMGDCERVCQLLYGLICFSYGHNDGQPATETGW